MTDEKQKGKSAPTIVITTSSPKKEDFAQLPYLSALSITCQLERDLSFHHLTQYFNCYQFGHHTSKCPKEPLCHYCAHHTLLRILPALQLPALLGATYVHTLHHCMLTPVASMKYTLPPILHAQLSQLVKRIMLWLRLRQWTLGRKVHCRKCFIFSLFIN
jgi:hypothetical protein